MKREGHEPALDLKSYRAALGTFATGVTVITAIDAEGQPVGLTANSFTSVSLDPPLILVCLDQRSKTLPAIAAAQAFCVNVLAEEQRDLAMRFASKAPDKFDGIAWDACETGSPILAGSLSWLDCRLDRLFTAGDHEVAIGRVVRYADQAALPLGYFRGGFFSVSMEQGASSRRGQALFGAIIEHEGRVLLNLDARTGRWMIPSALASGSGLPLGGLHELLAQAGVSAQMHFLFSVAELPDHGQTSILYRGEPVGTPDLKDPGSWRFFSSDDIPWDALASYEVEMTLRRYFHERLIGRFSLFADMGTGGSLGLIDPALSSYSPADAERTLRPRA